MIFQLLTIFRLTKRAVFYGALPSRPSVQGQEPPAEAAEGWGDKARWWERSWRLTAGLG